LEICGSEQNFFFFAARFEALPAGVCDAIRGLFEQQGFSGAGTIYKSSKRNSERLNLRVAGISFRKDQACCRSDAIGIVTRTAGSF
jgi:hypothetical protein